jgi:hypothetical protein
MRVSLLRQGLRNLLDSRSRSGRKLRFCSSPLRLEELETRTVLSGTWTALAHAAPSGIGTMFLLSDGTVMAQGSGISKNWYHLTPDSSGSYQNGTWTTLAAMHNTRLYMPSQVLPDGRVWLAGGEYGDGTTTGEIYDPLTNVWTTTTQRSPADIGDISSEILPDGKIIVGYRNTGGTSIYDPIADTWTAGPAKLRGTRSSEESWLLLPDQSILTYEIYNSTHSQRFVPSLNKWVDAGNLPFVIQEGLEVGPALLLPDGRAFMLGANGKSALYTLGANPEDPGSWAAGPTLDGNRGAWDTPGVALPDGRLLVAVGPRSYSGPTSFVTYDPGTNTFTNEPSPTFSGPPYTARFLMLPDGNVLFTSSSNQLYIYTPEGTPLASSAPAIAGIAQNDDGSFTLTGTQLNGVSEGAAYGDDAEMSSNYPIVRLDDGNGNIYYARTSNWSSTGVQTGDTQVTTQFTLPDGLPAGHYSLSVVANGIPSAAWDFDTPPSPPQVPSGWSGTDVGNPSQAGLAHIDGTTWTIKGGGAGIGTSPDAFHFASLLYTGDAIAVAQITSLNNTDPGAQAGVMFRDSTAADALFVSMVATPGNGVAFEWRTAAGDQASSSIVPDVAGPSSSTPVWVEIVRQGDSFTGYYSLDGTTWNQVGSAVTVHMASAARVGLAVTANNDSYFTTAIFTNVAVTDQLTPGDIGSPAQAGSASYDPSTNTWTVQGGGSGIGPTTDQFHFASKTYTSDGVLFAEVTGITNTDAWAGGGVMFRDGTAADAMFVSVMATQGNGVALQWRTSTGGQVQTVTVSAGPPTGDAPIWVEFVRSGNTFTAYYATTTTMPAQSDWIQIGSPVTVTIASTAYVGLAVTSNNTGSLNTATFTNVDPHLLDTLDTGTIDTAAERPAQPQAALVSEESARDAFFLALSAPLTDKGVEQSAMNAAVPFVVPFLPDEGEVLAPHAGIWGEIGIAPRALPVRGTRWGLDSQVWLDSLTGVEEGIPDA